MKYIIRCLVIIASCFLNNNYAKFETEFIAWVNRVSWKWPNNRNTANGMGPSLGVNLRYLTHTDMFYGIQGLFGYIPMSSTLSSHVLLSDLNVLIGQQLDGFQFGVGYRVSHEKYRNSYNLKSGPLISMTILKFGLENSLVAPYLRADWLPFDLTSEQNKKGESIDFEVGSIIGKQGLRCIISYKLRYHYLSDAKLLYQGLMTKLMF